MRWYYLVGQIVRPAITGAFYVYNKMFDRPRVRVVVKNEDGEVLLIRNWGGTRAWSLPGGGIERSEQPLSAAQRELEEETGIAVQKRSLRYIDTLTTSLYKAPIYTVTVARSQLPEKPINPWEITHVQWCDEAHLPRVTPLTQAALRSVADKS